MKIWSYEDYNLWNYFVLSQLHVIYTPANWLSAEVNMIVKSDMI